MDEIVDRFGNALQIGDTILICNGDNAFYKYKIEDIIITKSNIWIKYGGSFGWKKKAENVVKYIGK